MTIARVRSATSSITNKVLEIGIKIMNVNINIKNRLNQELKNGITLEQLKSKSTTSSQLESTLEQLKSKLYNEMDFYDDCGYTCQKMDTYKDIKVVEYWIGLENNN